MLPSFFLSVLVDSKLRLGLMKAPIEYVDCFCMVLHGEGQILPVLGRGFDGTSAATICPDCVSTWE
jgi:hypothetical protein